MKRANYVILLLVFTVTLFATRPISAQPAASQTVSAPTARQGPVDPAEVEAFLDQLFNRQIEEHQLVGVAAVVVKDGQVLFQKGYGFADLEKHIPVDPAVTLFRIGSVTKLFTWTAVLQLVEQGKLDLNADINTYLDFQIPATFPEPITLKHFMNHTDGFEERAYEMVAYASDPIPSSGKFLAAHLPSRVYPPGQVSVYTDHGADLAGYIIERVSGMSYADYIEARILKPLGMAHTTARQPLPVHLAESMSNGYRFVGNNLEAFDLGLISVPASGAIRSTAEDMGRFMIAHLQGGNRCSDEQNNACSSILQADTEKLMQSTIWEIDPGKAGYTYGFMEMNYHGQLILQHSGDAGGFHNLLMLLPDANLGFFVTYNTTSPSFTWINTLDDFMNYYYPEEPAANMPATSLGYDLQSFTGGYQSIRGSYTSIEKVTRLLNWIDITDSGDGALLVGTPFSTKLQRLEQVEPLKFREASTGSPVIFQKDDQGKIAYLYDQIPIYPMAGYVKAPWHAHPFIHLGLLGVCALLFLSVLLAGFFGLFIRLFKRGEPVVQPVSARLARGIALVVALLNLLALVVFLMITLVTGEFSVMIAYGHTTVINVILAVWLLGALLTVILVVLTVLAWKQGFWGIPARLHYTLMASAALAFIWFLNYWNLLGFRY